MTCCALIRSYVQRLWFGAIALCGLFGSRAVVAWSRLDFRQFALVLVAMCRHHGGMIEDHRDLEFHVDSILFLKAVSCALCISSAMP